ncbi:hypothetical protein PFISCL1PPCAC_12811 [Pristionchus fissidentatus]|uniref:Cytochrome P450 n=1 Tax=Pristionchus fissidentatus TaxID=1538716 RepID=A0AAV5VPQ3_9BILA|nr:hypothetical protein PFISCL1PPCAC_12811 [Pristionchus fissidentatus]
MIYLIALLAVLLFAFGRGAAAKWANFRHRKRLSALIPGDEGLPIFGNIFELGRTPEAGLRSFLERAKAARDDWNGTLVKLWIMHDSVFMPTSGEMLQPLLESSEEINKGEDYNILKSWLGTGLLLAGADKWRSRRKMLTPTFHFSQLDGYVATMNRHAKVLVDVLEDHADHEFDVFPLIKRCTLDTICATAMGKDLDSLHQPEQPYVEAIAKIGALNVKQQMLPHLWSSFGRRLFGWQKENDANVTVAHALTNEVIAERIASRAKGEADVNKKAFLDRLISEMDKTNLSIEDIREEVDTFMFAGHDTTSSALGWTIWCLANHPEIQQRVYEEITSVFGEDEDIDCTSDEMAQLVYLDRCIKESLRLFPPVPFALRRLDEDLQMGPYLLPRGSTLCISPYLVHRNERIYPNPLVYDPDRFLPENVERRHPYDFVPFSAGPRNCIGQKFAMNQLKIFISWILRRYRIESERAFDERRELTEVILKSGDGINIVLRDR